MKRRWVSSVLAFVVSWCSAAAYGQAGEGAQFLDGIGETALIARYLFNGNSEDWSRNAYHATLHGEATYVDDEQFGRVLSLPGGRNGGYVQVPGRALMDIESLSITGWINVKDLTPWQRFYDLGMGNGRYLYCTPVGQERADGCRVRMTASGYGAEKGPAAFRVATGQWVHLATVLDAATKTLSLYVDGVRVGQSTDVTWPLSDILSQEDASANRVYIGKSLYDGDALLGGKVCDVRFYGIALTDRQIAVIRGNAISAEDATVAGPVTPMSDEPQRSGEDTSSLYGAEVTSVPDIAAQTVVGCLPHLPITLPAKCADGTDGPEVRVIWPAPTDNSQVQQPGTYTITATVPGTAFAPKSWSRLNPRRLESPGPSSSWNRSPWDRWS